MDPERETKFRSAFGELRPWVDASLTVAKALLTQSRHYYCLGRGPTKGGELPVSLPSAGVLIRALEPLEGIPIMRLNRGIERLRDLARGPGRLTAALRVDRRFDGLDLCREGPLWLGRCGHVPGEIGQSTRIGIARDANRFLRFYLRGSPFVSGPRTLRE